MQKGRQKASTTTLHVILCNVYLLAYEMKALQQNQITEASNNYRANHSYSSFEQPV